MFISSGHLVKNYDVDDKIARFFADREPPADNLYWKGKLLYLRPAPGYLFIPLIVDLLHKAGIDREQLLSDAFVSVMENIGHFSALEETGQISNEEAIKSCAHIVKDGCKSSDWYNNLLDFFDDKDNNFFTGLATPFKALHRGDVFLYSISVLQFTSELKEKIAQLWFALISTLLLLDDADDIENDRETGDENAFLESGLDQHGFKKIEELVKRNLQVISLLNPVMAAELGNQYEEMVENLVIPKLPT